MSRGQTDWIDKRLRETTALGEASALVTNDITANLPSVSTRPLVIVIEISGGSLNCVYADISDGVRVVLIKEGNPNIDPKRSTQSLEVKPLSALDKVLRSILFHAGINLPERE